MAKQIDRISVTRAQTLIPQFRDLAILFLNECLKGGIFIRITSAFRTNEEQDMLFAIGRTVKPDSPIVTRARGGQSMHNYGAAIDVVPMNGRNPVWNDEQLWQRVAAIGERIGLEWAGRWTQFKEYPHFQLKGYTVARLRALPKDSRGLPILP